MTKAVSKMTYDNKSCLKAIIMWILVGILLIISNTTGRVTIKSSAINEKNLIVENKDIIRAEKIDNYFAKNKMPLFGSGKIFVKEANEHNLDWRLLAAISVQESTGGKRMPEGSYNAFGWNSGNYKFKNFEEAIAYISDKFENGKYYAGKDIIGILKTYNPPSVNKNYPNEVIDIMETIETEGGRSTPLIN